MSPSVEGFGLDPVTRLDFEGLRQRWTTPHWTPSRRTVERRAKHIGRLKLGRQVIFPVEEVEAYERKYLVAPGGN